MSWGWAKSIAIGLLVYIDIWLIGLSFDAIAYWHLPDISQWQIGSRIIAQIIALGMAFVAVLVARADV